MNRQKVIGISILVTGALLVITTGVVFAAGLAQGEPPFYAEDGNSEYGQYWGPMHGRGRRTTSGAPFSPMHEEMVQAVADATGLTVAQIEDRIAQGERLIEIALDAGLSEDEFFNLMTETRQAYIEEAFKNGWISEERYQWMLARNQGEEAGRGYGQCHRYDGERFPTGGRGAGRGQGRRW